MFLFLFIYFQFSSEDTFIDLEREKKGGRERETLMWETQIACLPQAPRPGIVWGSNLQPRRVPWRTLDPAAIVVYGTALQQIEPPGQGIIVFKHLEILWYSFYVQMDYLK